MKRYVLIGLGVLLVASMGLVGLSKEKPPAFIEMEVKGVSIDTIGQSPVVILIDKEGAKALPIWIGLLEANAIDREMRNVTTPRPMTHDLLLSILTQTQAKVKEVKIVNLKDNTYFATLFLTLNRGVLEVDARPSDAIILALKSKAPIFVSSRILENQGIAFTPKEAFGERSGIRIQELTPSLAVHFNFKGRKGVLVSEVVPGSPSGSSGIKAGDIITKINSKEIGTVQEFEEILDGLKAGSVVRVFLFRNEKFQEISFPLKP